MIEILVDDCFLIGQILECGQSFRYKHIENNIYDIIAYDKRLRINQVGKHVYMDCSIEDYNSLWVRYFDMDRNYEQIQSILVKMDPILKKAVIEKRGLRILRQAPFEMLLTFILSQNKAIPQIKVLVERLCETYGQVVLDQYGTYYTFPTVDRLVDVSVEDWRRLKVGFRAPYLYDAIQKVAQGVIDFITIEKMLDNSARDRLMEISGVGQKVADCILLFAFGRIEVFPLDVWVRRMMTHAYFNDQNVSDQIILEFADRYFKGFGGLAQQYLFYYARDHQIGK
ncbi:8-oxoguanine DNA glycosylase [Petrocella atlantisensis]|uniref:DNA-(apurinic or apyrimidinic site) lyase n=1 Tax=Petrocella atlantisensis TaxID=2173034 RepID=A0A3P7RVI7_9FIRM|nr:DNA glycosylase [Petrocella atlantisensis]VDN46796.1 8-oxoguanine DNA glycosylase [Petrocella atlantisensis]